MSLLSLPAAAQSHTGVITHVRIDSAASAAFCVATSPQLQGAAWACLYPRRAHYREMHDLLVRAFEGRLACTFEWSLVDSLTRQARIEALTCPQAPGRL